MLAVWNSHYCAFQAHPESSGALPSVLHQTGKRGINASHDCSMKRALRAPAALLLPVVGLGKEIPWPDGCEWCSLCAFPTEATMSETSVRTFPHRKNADSTWEAICPDCLRTIARVKDSSELDAVERAHDCERFAKSGDSFGMFSDGQMRAILDK